MNRFFRTFPTLLRVGFSGALAYRAEMLVWVLATTMPLIMLAFWTAVAHDAPIGRFGEKELVVYFLVTFIVRQLTGAWVAWEINFEVKQGTIGSKLLRPMHPALGWAADNLAAMPMRVVVSLPVAIIMLATTGGVGLPKTPLLWLAGMLALFGGWAITFLVNLVIGTLSFYMESSVKVMDAWTVLVFVFSGYLIPIELFPKTLRAITEMLPFRYSIGLPVEIFVGAHTPSELPWLLARQLMWVLAFLGLFLVLWRGGLRRYAAYGG